MINAIINSNVGLLYGSEIESVYLSSLDPKNRFVDVEFNRSVWGDSANISGLSTSSFSLNLTTNGGDVTSVSISSVKQIDSEVEADATALSGGEMFVRIFINPDTYPSGVETINISVVGSSCYDIQGNSLGGETGELTLSPLPFAVMGNDFIWWDASEAAHTEGIYDRGRYEFTATYDSGYEGTAGTDVDGDYIDTTSEVSAPFDSDSNSQFEPSDNEYLIFVKHKYAGDINTPLEQGNFFDMANERTIPCYPFGTNDEWGCIFVGSGNTNLQSSGSPGLTNNAEILHYKFQSGTLEQFKDNVSSDTAGAYSPYTWTGGGALFSHNSTSNAQNYNGKVYQILVMKGTYTSGEITSLYNWMNNL